ncbi:MAG: glycerophosphodiester phosphodiesterase [Bauldia sp.]|nr:glycerophosphodiester phosphodiesterase [Bauldia sp.]
MRAPRRDLGWLTARPVAHRGLHDQRLGVPENTLPAFMRAARAGYPVELDVRLTRDGVAMVFHDATLERLTGAAGAVAQTSFKAMRKLGILGTSAPPPALAEVLAAVAGRVPILVEVKSPDDSGSLEAAVATDLAAYRGRVAVMSFSAASVAWFRANAPHLPRGLVSGSWRGEADAVTALRRRWLLHAAAAAPDFIAHEITCLGDPAARAWRATGRPLLAWTAHTPPMFSAASRLADAVIFERLRPPPR